MGGGAEGGVVDLREGVGGFSQGHFVSDLFDYYSITSGSTRAQLRGFTADMSLKAH
jgi:hypothetical protein